MNDYGDENKYWLQDCGHGETYLLHRNRRIAAPMGADERPLRHIVSVMNATPFHAGEAKARLTELEQEVSRLRGALEGFVKAYDDELWPIENEGQLFDVARQALGRG